jgi:hypothetical protein
MLQKISREDCLMRYPVFPLRHYDEASDEEECYYLKVISGTWMELGVDSGENLTTRLAQELTSLFACLKVEKLIFLGDTGQSWITKQGSKRKDYLPFTQAVDYFIHHHIENAFNGAVIVDKGELGTFLYHFYTLVRCDASLTYFHFIDNNQQFLGTIHYSGQIRIDTFDKAASLLLEGQIVNTEFRVVAK